jgi:tetratricopeptide (TPR) repeat protein
MDEQLSLFIEENTLFNASIQHLLNLEFKKCPESLQRYRRLYPRGKKIGREMAMAEFWINKLGEINWDPVDGAEAERRVGIWLEFEDQFGYPWPEHSFEKRFQEQYFGRIAKSLDASGQGVAPKLGQGTCTGLVYLRAGRPDEAITLLQKLVALEAENARAYGYLGDACLRKNQLRRGRMFYQTAFALGPDEVDLRHLGDCEVRTKLRDLEGDERLDGDPRGWFPAIARIEGLFEPLLFTDEEELRNWTRRYQRLREVYREYGEPGLLSRLFNHAMVLSDNVSMRRCTMEIDLIEVRKQMKEWQGDLFSAYMEKLQEEEGML